MQARGDLARWLHEQEERAAGRTALADTLARLTALREQLLRMGCATCARCDAWQVSELYRAAGAFHLLCSLRSMQLIVHLCCIAAMCTELVPSTTLGFLMCLCGYYCIMP